MVVWLFPGQGAQYVGMGKSLCESSPAAREVFERADQALGRSITKLCFEGPEHELSMTINTQPAIVATSVAILAAVKEALGDSFVRPVCAAGHSLGEYSALVAAGALQFEDAIRLVHIRGQAMQQAVPLGQGSMAAILAAAEVVEDLCREVAGEQVLAPANYNAPNQVVIAGHADAVQRAIRLAATRRIRALPLKVSAPFHCSLMTSAAERMEEELKSIQLSPPRFPVIHNVDAKPNKDSVNIRRLLVDQVTSPVRWVQSVQQVVRLGAHVALELGPGNVLAGLVRRIASLEVLSVAAAGDVKQLELRVAENRQLFSDVTGSSDASPLTSQSMAM